MIHLTLDGPPRPLKDYLQYCDEQQEFLKEYEAMWAAKKNKNSDTNQQEQNPKK